MKFERVHKLLLIFILLFSTFILFNLINLGPFQLQLESRKLKVLIIFDVILIVSLLKLSKFYIDKINYYFVYSVTIITTALFLWFPSLGYRAEVWAEAGTNFFIHAYNEPFFRNLLIPDAGYLPLLQRMIALIGVKAFNIIEYYPYYVQIVSIIGIALFSSIISLNTYRSVIKSDVLRFLLGTFIGLGITVDYELLTFINFTYIGIVFIILILFTNIERYNWVKLILVSILSLLLLTSKPYYVVFTPIILVLLVMKLRKKDLKSSIFYGASLVALIIQCIVMMRNSGIWISSSSASSETNGHILIDLLKILILYIKTYFWFIFEFIGSDKPVLLVICLTIGIGLLCYYAFRVFSNKEYRIQMYFFLVCNFIALASIALTVITQSYIKDWSIETLFWYIRTPFSRHFLFSNISIILSLFALFTAKYQNYNRQKTQVIVGVLLLLFLFINGFNVRELYPTKELSYSQWGVYHELLEEEEYCIPINPYPWAVCNNMKILTVYDGKDQPPVSQFNIQDNIDLSENWQIKAMTIRNNIIHDKVKIKAVDDKGHEVEPLNITPEGNQYSYFLFDSKVKIDTIYFYGQDNTPITIIPELVLFGVD